MPSFLYKHSLHAQSLKSKQLPSEYTCGPQKHLEAAKYPKETTLHDRFVKTTLHGARRLIVTPNLYCSLVVQPILRWAAPSTHCLSRRVHQSQPETWVYAYISICKGDDSRGLRQCTQPKRLTIQENSRNCLPSWRRKMGKSKRRNFVGRKLFIPWCGSIRLHGFK